MIYQSLSWPFAGAIVVGVSRVWKSQGSTENLVYWESKAVTRLPNKSADLLETDPSRIQDPGWVVHLKHASCGRLWWCFGSLLGQSIFRRSFS